MNAIRIGNRWFHQTPPCFECGEQTNVEVDPEKYLEWILGDSLIQEVWPESTPEWREILKTGTHAECWDRMFQKGM